MTESINDFFDEVLKLEDKRDIEDHIKTFVENLINDDTEIKNDSDLKERLQLESKKLNDKIIESIMICYKKIKNYIKNKTSSNITDEFNSELQILNCANEYCCWVKKSQPSTKETIENCKEILFS